MAKYQQYGEYKDSGVEWLGEIPIEWNLLRGKWRFKSLKEVNRNLQCMERLALTMRGVIERSIESDDGLQPLKFSGYQIFEKNDLVFKLIDLENYKTSRVGLVFKKGIMSPAYIRLQPFSSVYPKFYYYLYFDLYLRGIYNEIGGQGVRSALNASDLLELEVCVPNITEQAQIANFLDYEIGQIDTLIDKQQTLIQLLKEKRQAVISHAVTKGLNPNAPMKDSGVEWLGEVPEPWDVVKLSYRYEVLLGKMLDDKKITGAYLCGYIRNTDVQWNGINTENLPQMDFRPEERERYSVKKGDLVVCEGGDIGRSAIWDQEEDCFYQKALHRLRPHDPARDSAKFMLYVMFDAVHQERFSGGLAKATIAHLPAEKFRQYRFAYPLYTEQLEISAYLDEMSSKFEALESSAQRQIELLQERRTALISAAVTGKIDVRGWQVQGK